MTLNEFLAICNGQYIEMAGTDARNQCVDSANCYIKYVLGLPIIEWTNAVDFPSRAGDNYEYILNTPNGVPQEGDLVIWGGTYGHIAIFIEGNSTRFTSFDENYPTGSPCHVQEHTYLSPKVLGWLHPRVVLSDMQAQLDQLRTERDTNWNYFIAVCDALKVGSNVDVAVAEATKLLTIEQTVLDKDRQLAEVQKQAGDLQTQLTLKQQVITEVSAQVATLTVEVGKAQQTIDILTQQNKNDQLELEALRKAAEISQGLKGFKKWLFDTFIRN